MSSVSKDEFAFLQSIDTPTVCNLIEIVVPARRGSGYTVRHLHCPFPDLPPMVGFAKTVTIRSKDAFGMFALLVTSGVLWLLYGLVRHDWPVVATNVGMVTLTGILLAAKVRFK